MPQDKSENRQVSLDEWERMTFERYGVPENLRRSVLGQESAGGTRLKSPTGVKGRYMVTKDTAAQYGYDRDDQWQQPVAAAKHLRTLYDGVKKRNPGFSDKQAWLGASAEYYYGKDAFDAGGNLSTKSRDGYSTPAKYATSIAERWSAYDRGETPQTTPAPQSETEARRPAPMSAARRLGIEPVEWPEGKVLNLNRNQFEAPQSRPPAPRKSVEIAPKKRSAAAALLGYEPSTGDPYGDRSTLPARAETARRRAEIERKQAEFAARPFYERWAERGWENLAIGGAPISHGARRIAEAVVGEIPAWRRFEAERDAELARRAEERPSSFGTEVVEGIIQGAPSAAAIGLGAAGLGGGTLATMGVGGGYTALTADWKDPKRAVAQTALNAVAPVVGGKIGQKIAGPVASRFTRPAAQAAARVGGELVGGGAANVGQSAAEQALFTGQVSPRELAKSAAIGSVMTAPGALAGLRGGARSLRDTARQEVQPTQPLQYPDAPPTARMPVLSRADIENAPTAGLPATPRAVGQQPTVEAAPRRLQHSRFGTVTESSDQSGTGSGQLRVIDAGGNPHIIRNPRATGGNREASFVTPERPELSAVVDAPTAPGLTVRDATQSATVSGPRQAEAALTAGAQTPESSAPGLRGRIAETAGGVQVAAQLGNPRFVIRNVLGHVAFGKQERAATRLAAALDWAYSKATGKPRQITAPRGSDIAAYVRNWRKAVEAYKKGEPLPGRPNEDYLTADSNAIDRGVNKLMTWINEIPDAAMWQTRFEESLQSITKAAERSKRPLDMDAAIDQAKLEADRASLRDPNFVSNAMLKIKQGLNTLSSPVFGTDKFGVGDFVAKYVRTPGALLKRGLERSPLGLFQVAKEAATPGPFRRRNTLMALSRVAEGAASGIGFGAALAAAGVLVGPDEEGRAGKAMEREEGVRGYSFNANALVRLLTGDSTEMRGGDQLYSVDWLQPWAMNLSVGGALWNLHKRGEMGPGKAATATGEAVYNSLAKTLDVMGDQSLLKNLGRYMRRATGDDFSQQFLSFTREVGLDVPSSFVPSILRQTRQVIDPYERDTRAEDRAGVRGAAREAANRALQNLPGVSQTFPTRPSLLTGEDKKTALGQLSAPARVAAQFSPANVSIYAPQPVAREISRLSRAGHKVSVSFPRAETDKQTGRREPTPSLREKERRFAEAFAQLSREMIEHPDYDFADDEVRAEALNALKRHISAAEKVGIEEKAVAEIIDAASRTVERRRIKQQP